MKLLLLNPSRNKYKQTRNYLDDLIFKDIGKEPEEIKKHLKTKPRQLAFF